MFYIKIFEKYPNYTICAAACILSLITYFPLYDAAFWIIDDHESIAMRQAFIESGSGLWHSLYNIWLGTEIGGFPNDARFRPLYYFVRIVKSILFENNSTYWFLFQTTILCTSLFAFGQAIKNFLPISITVLTMGLLASLPFNLDMWSRLGPGENGAFFFFMLFLLALSRLGKNTWAWPLSCVAAAATMGYKENFILLIIPLCIGYYYIKYTTKQRISILWAVLPCIMSILLAIVFINILRGNTAHIYAATTSTMSSIKIAYTYFMTFHFTICVLSVLPLIFAKYFLCQEYNTTNIKKELLLLTLIFIVVIILSCGNYTFYQGHIGRETRYAFPYLFFLIIPPLLTASFYMRHLKNNTLLHKVGICCVAVLIVFTAYSQFKIFSHSLKQTAITHNFKQILTMGKNAGKIILVNTSQPINLYEPYFSLKIFSKARLTASEIIYFPLFFPVPDSALNRKLETTLKQATAEHTELAFNDENALFVTQRNGTLKIIDIASSVRKPENIPTEIETTASTTKTHFFLLVLKQPVTAFELIGSIPAETVFSVNGTKFTAEKAIVTPQSTLLTLAEEDVVNKSLALYIITLESRKNNNTQHSLTNIVVHHQP